MGLKSEIFRYLGYGEKTPDEKIQSIIDECLDEIKRFNPPKYVYKILDVNIKENIEIEGGLIIKSLSLKEHLQDCDKIAVMAATLGTQADLAISKYNKLDMTKALVFNACANAHIEQTCDRIENEIKANNQLTGRQSVFRFSPGYGDFSFMYQKLIMDIVDAKKNIGITLSDSYLLIPTKSVTAIIGFLKKGKEHKTINSNRISCANGEKCENCSMKDSCNFSQIRGGHNESFK